MTAHQQSDRQCNKKLGQHDLSLSKLFPRCDRLHADCDCLGKLTWLTSPGNQSRIKMNNKESRDFLLVREWLSGGLANAIASAALNPVDVTKTRLQAAVAQSGSKPRVFLIVKGIYQESGLLGLWRPGLSASMTREMLYSGPRAGFYVPVRNAYQKLFGQEANAQSLPVKLAAALTTGKLALAQRF
ncbi:solute carrier family 25 protein [archaeon]|nr:MAG: solute carrier family 25 protein [archaeon]